MTIFARPSRIYIRNKTISVHSPSELPERFRGWEVALNGMNQAAMTLGLFETAIFMTCCRRLTKYSNNCPVSASFK
jgi:hypothetical protein